MFKKLVFLSTLLLLSPLSRSAELSGVFVDDQITTENGETLVLNGIGVREYFWIDVYVGSLYLSKKTNNVADVLSSQKAWRIQMNFVYKEVDKEDMVTTWREGFHMNQNEDVINSLGERMDQFYSYFDQNVVAKDLFTLDYIPGKGTTVTKNKKVLGTIPGEDFENALLEIWLGNFPADDGLKRGMLGM